MNYRNFVLVVRPRSYSLTETSLLFASTHPTCLNPEDNSLFVQGVGIFQYVRRRVVHESPGQCAGAHPSTVDDMFLEGWSGIYVGCCPPGIYLAHE